MLSVDKLILLRQSRNISREELANRLNMTVKEITDLECNKLNFNKKSYDNWLKAIYYNANSKENESKNEEEVITDTIINIVENKDENETENAIKNENIVDYKNLKYDELKEFAKKYNIEAHKRKKNDIIKDLDRIFKK